MISFIKLHSEIFILLFLLFLTVDAFILIIKFFKNLESLPNLKISYDISKSYYLDFSYDNELRLGLIYLTIENKSTKPIDILDIQLLDKDMSYSATIPKIERIYNENGIILFSDNNSESTQLNIISENILLKNMNLLSQDAIKGYAVFENLELISDAYSYTIIIKTPKKIFKSEITLNPLAADFQIINTMEG